MYESLQIENYAKKLKCCINGSKRVLVVQTKINILELGSRNNLQVLAWYTVTASHSNLVLKLTLRSQVYLVPHL